MDDWLSRYRFAHRFDGAPSFRAHDLGVRLLDGGALALARVAPERWLWTAWATVRLDEEIKGVAAIQRFLARYHYWAPNYPGDAVPLLELPGGDGSTSMLQFLESALPEQIRGILAGSLGDGMLDQRLAVFASLHAVELPRGEGLRSLIDLDAPVGMEAPPDWTDQWLCSRVYRRWESHGFLWGFTHHSAILLHPGRAWIDGLCRPRWPADGARNEGAYFDLALLVFSEIALAVTARTQAIGERGMVELGEVELERTARCLTRVFSTPSDQGRALLARWRAVYRRDLGLHAREDEEET